MGTPVGEMHIRNADTEREVRYAVLHVIDIKTRKESYCVDEYDVHNELVRRIGYTNGPVVSDNGIVTYGDELVEVNLAKDKKLIIDLTPKSETEYVLEEDSVTPVSEG